MNFSSGISVIYSKYICKLCDEWGKVCRAYVFVCVIWSSYESIVCQCLSCWVMRTSWWQSRLLSGAAVKQSPYHWEIGRLNHSDASAIKIAHAVWEDGHAFSPLSITATLASHGHQWAHVLYEKEGRECFPLNVFCSSSTQFEMQLAELTCLRGSCV